MAGRKVIDLLGMRFERLLVTGQMPGRDPKGHVQWRVTCDCGTEAVVLGASLRSGGTRSCGCLRRETMSRTGKATATHGAAGTRLYRTWKGMKNRCQTPKNPGFHNYGGRGIRVCYEWLDYPTFEAWALASGYRDDLTIERIGVNGHYQPENCTWIRPEKQAANRRNRYYTAI